jgi:amino acid/amide ABC transporter membrane protein 1, HAAT family (TC 3.A.1.4.-)
MGCTAAILIVLYVFFTRTLFGKAVLATANNTVAARIVGINTNVVVSLSFAVSAAVGAVGGLLITPISLTNAEIGIPLALKGFAGAMLGGLGSPLGAVVGGLLIGLIEALTASYISSAYKEASAFLVIILVLVFMPNGLFGKNVQERV